MKRLLLDLGNTRLKWISLDDPGEAEAPLEWRVHTEVHVGKPLEELLEKHWGGLSAPSVLQVASVAGEAANNRLTAWIQQQWHLDPCFVHSATRFKELRNGYSRPVELGVDRWLSMVATWKKYHCACCVLDLGSAVTLDLIAADGRHSGGYILPGCRAIPELLARHTQIGDLADRFPGRIGWQPGITTAEAVAHGTAAAILGLLRTVLEPGSNMVPQSPERSTLLLLTGGDAAAFLPLCRLLHGVKAIHEPHLVLQGLAEVTG